MLNLVKKNPYRFLGVYSNSLIKERVANVNKLKAYLKVGKKVSFPSDIADLIPLEERTVDGLETANASLNLPVDQIKYALFWFINGTSMDAVALGHLQAGNVEKCLEILSKKESFSSLINRGVISFIQGKTGESIDFITRVIHDNGYRMAFLASVVGNDFQIAESDLATMFIDSLQQEISVWELKELFKNYGKSTYENDILTARAIDALRNEILNAISEAKGADNTPVAQYNAGVRLMKKTSNPLAGLKGMLGTNDMAFQTVADKLATQILQCGINYYNKSTDEEDVQIEKAYSLQNYALSIAVGRLAIERCAENVAILEKKKKELPPKNVRFYDKMIKELLVAAAKKPNKSTVTIELVEACAPYLASIKAELGSSHTYYLQISTIVVAAGLSKVIDEFNSMMTDTLKIQLIIDRENTLRNLRTMFRSAWKATLYLDHLDMESNFRNSRFNPQKSVLKKQVSELIDVDMSVRLDMRSDDMVFAACNSIRSYNHYLEIFREGKHVVEAKDALEKLDFKECKSIAACKAFMLKYPKSKCPVKELLEELIFKEAAGSIVKLQEYMKNYPRGVYYKEAAKALELCEFEACGTLEDWRRYLQTYPQGLYRTQANACIVEESFWIECINSEGEDKYKEYLAKYPNGRHRKEAERKASACYIATMVYGDYNHPQVVALRGFRDNILRSSHFGCALISFYYKNSPTWVEKMQGKTVVNHVIRKALNMLIKIYKHGI